MHLKLVLIFSLRTVKSFIKSLIIDYNNTVVCFDWNNIFSNIPIIDSSNSVNEKLEKDSSLSERTNLAVDSIVDLLSLCLESIYFLIYIRGAASQD